VNGLDFLTLAGGLALFLYGMRLSGDYLQKAAGRGLRRVIAALTSNRVAAAGVGAGVTACTNSSSATGVILVALTHAEVIPVHRALAVLLGAAVGTTITIQLIAFKLTVYALGLVAAGFALSAAGTRKTRLLGGVVMAFGFIFFGMHLMSSAMEPILEDPAVMQAVRALAGSPYLMVLLGLAVTAVIQSSSASIGVLVALVMAGSGEDVFTLQGCFGFVLGANVGTCVTTILASIGCSYKARRLAFAFLMAKGAAVLVFLPLIGVFCALLEDAVRLVDSGVTMGRLIAHSHLAFNIVLAAVFLPLLGLLERAAARLTPEREFPELLEKPRARYLSERVLSTPHVALATVRKELVHMLETALAMVDTALTAFTSADAERYGLDLEHKLDVLTIAVVQYLAKLSQKDLEAATSSEIVACLSAANEIEAMGDVVAKTLLPQARKYRDRSVKFSAEGWEEIRGFHAEVSASLRDVVVSLRMENAELAGRVIERQDAITVRARELRLAHMQRLAGGKPESHETSTIHMDVLSDLAAVHTYAAAVARNLLEIY
jgi:phosphate:Na+ symporter